MERNEPGASPRAALVLGRFGGGAAALVVFEVALYFVAVVLFPHIDTQSCAATNTFCSPTGRPGATGGAVTFLLGNALVPIAVLIVLASRSARGSRRRTRG